MSRRKPVDHKEKVNNIKNIWYKKRKIRIQYFSAKSYRCKKSL